MRPFLPHAAVGLDGGRVDDPGGDVQGMDELFGDDVAGKNAIEPPGTDLAFRVVGIIAASPDLPAVVDGLAGDDVADIAGMHAANRLLEELAGAGLEIDQHDAFFLGPFAAGVGHRLATGHIDGDWLGAVDVAAGIDSGDGVLGMEVRRGFDHDRIRPSVQQPLVARQAAEGLALGHAERLGRGLGPIGKVVGRGHELVSAMLLEQVGDPPAPPAAADQAERDFGVGFRGRDLPGLDDQ